MKKLYKLKEEARKYLQEEHWKRHWNVEQSLDRWLNTTCMNEEALEEVPERIKVMHTEYLPEGITILKVSGNQVGKWEDIETFLNDFGSIDKLKTLISEFALYYNKEDMPLVFEKWIKRQ